MSDTVVSVENLGKRYRISVGEEQPTTLRELLVAAARSPFSYLSEMMRPPTEAETLWALRNVSFEVKRGEVLGIVGHNGAGKSTLLKILSRITDPTEGRAVIQGRVGSLLEVGTGFHPDLTGRHNVYMNGAILGMKKREIDANFDEIVEFADVGRFIDTPVKRYSSGMRVRLAFAVAAHLQPEVLIVDEVLAVGDAAFQRRSLGRMEHIAGHGRTVLFVSHSMPAIQALCHRAILLEHGTVIRSGSPDEIVTYYLETVASGQDAIVDLRRHPNRSTPPEDAALTQVCLTNEEGRPTATFQMGERVTFEISLDLGERSMRDPLVMLAIEKRGIEVCNLSTRFMMRESVTLTGRMTARCTWDLGPLGPGVYTIADVMIKAHSGGVRLDAIEEVTTFEIRARDVYGTGKLPHDSKLIVPPGTWTVEPALQPLASLAADKA